MILGLAVTFAALTAPDVRATWSVIAVDRATGEIGIAGASCTFDVQGIASMVPGKGAIVVQAASNYFARMKGVSLMREGATPQQVMEAMRDPEFNPERQQYGVVSITEESSPLVYSGSEINGWSGSQADHDVAVMGNILVDERVVEQAFEAFMSNRDKPFSDRLMLALSAGESAGGDSRCGSQYARSAFISVYDPKDGAILKLSIHGLEPGGNPAVRLLREQYEILKGQAE